jgi:beta-N-acetylhexosaminidase
MPRACDDWWPPPVAADRRLLWLGVALVGVLLASSCYTMAADPSRLAAATTELGQLLLVGFRGTAAEGNAELESLLCAHRVGGVLLFARNIGDAGQLRELTGWMRERSRACTGRELLIAVDAEGGRVMRLGADVGYTPTLSAEELGRGNDLAITELEAIRIARRLQAAGINWNLAPVVDVGYNPANPVIVGVGRSFGAHPVVVANHARAFIQGMRSEGILSTLKHFPGHGSSFGDSHLGFVDVTETANREVELLPYRILIGEGLADSVMTAHVFNRRLDPQYPATLSPPTITGAIEQHYGLGDAAILALAAGVDVLLIADDRLPDGRSATTLVLEALQRALDAGRLDLAQVEAAQVRVRRLASRLPRGS